MINKLLRRKLHNKIIGHLSKAKLQVLSVIFINTLNNIFSMFLYTSVYSGITFSLSFSSARRYQCSTVNCYTYVPDQSHTGILYEILIEALLLERWDVHLEAVVFIFLYFVSIMHYVSSRVACNYENQFYMYIYAESTSAEPVKRLHISGFDCD